MLVFATVPLGTPLVQKHAAVSPYIHVHCTHGKLADKEKMKLLRYRAQHWRRSGFRQSATKTPSISRATPLISGSVKELYEQYIQLQIYRRESYRRKLKDHIKVDEE